VTTLFPDFGFRAANQGGPCEGDAVVRLPMVRRQSEIDIAGDDLHAYVDAVLDAGHRSAIEARLARDPAAVEAATAYRTINIDLHRLFDRELPPLTQSLEALTRELERRLGARQTWSWIPPALVGLAVAGNEMRRSTMRAVKWLAGNPLQGVNPDLVVGRVGAAIDRSPLASVMVVALVITLGGLAWPLVAGQPASCAEKVESTAKYVAKSGLSAELAERLAGVGFMCRVGDTERADLLLARLDEEARQVGR
jgi:hypothetical protein